MTDKEKIRAEVVRLITDLGEQRDVLLEELLDFIDSIPKESHQELYDKLSKLRDDAFSNTTKESWEACLSEDPVSMWHDVSEEPKPNMELICVGQYGNPLVLSSNSDSFKSLYISKWAYFNDLLNLYNIQRAGKGWKEEPVSEDLEEAARRYGDELDNVLSVGVDDDNTVGEYAAQAYKMGAQRQREWIMRNAKTGVVTSDNYIKFDDGTYIDFDPTMQLKPAFVLQNKDKVKVIIVKEDEE